MSQAQPTVFYCSQLFDSQLTFLFGFNKKPYFSLYETVIRLFHRGVLCNYITIFSIDTLAAPPWCSPPAITCMKFHSDAMPKYDQYQKPKNFTKSQYR